MPNEIITYKELKKVMLNELLRSKIGEWKKDRQENNLTMSGKK